MKFYVANGVDKSRVEIAEILIKREEKLIAVPALSRFFDSR